MDIKEKIEEIVKKVMSDKELKAKFEKDPVKAIESVLGVDLPDEIINKVLDGVKTKINADSVSDVAEKLGGLLGKK